MNNEEKILTILGQMQGQIEKMDARQDRTETMLENLTADVGAMKTDISDLKQGQAKLEQGQADLKQDVRRLNQSVAVIESKVNHDFNIIIEGITDLNERNRQIDRLDDKVDSHDHRIWALEQAVKK